MASNSYLRINKPVPLNAGDPINVKYLLDHVELYKRYNQKPPRVLWLTEAQWKKLFSELSDHLLYSNDNLHENSFDGIPIKIIRT